MRLLRTLTAFAAVLSMLTIAAPAQALPPVDWVPNSVLLPPFPYAAGTTVTNLHLTRRIVPQPRVPGRFLLGHELNGLWQSEPGVGWVSLMPHCTTWVGSAYVSPLLGGVPTCGVEGIALADNNADPLAPLDVYVSSYHLGTSSPLSLNGVFNHGGVYKATLPAGNVGSAGLVWKQLLSGVRGNALAIKQSSSGPPTLIAGRLQRGPDVGVDSNIWCQAFGQSCNPSLYLSYDGGSTWTTRSFAGSPCPNGNNDVGTSSALVGNIAIDRNNNSVFYAAANSGLWMSVDNGVTWTNPLSSCGNAPGFAITETSTPNTERIYVGKNTWNLPDSTLWSATTGPNGAGAFGQIQLLDAATLAPMTFQGWVESVVIDRRDPTSRTMFVGSWQAFNPNGGGGTGGVYKVVDQGNGTAHVTDLKASFLEPYRDCLNLRPPTTDDCLEKQSLPYPLLFDPKWRPSLFLAQHPLLPDLIYASTVLGGVWTRSVGTRIP